MFSRLRVCFIAILTLFIALAVYGQGNAGITGIVNDSSGGVVPARRLRLRMREPD